MVGGELRSGGGSGGRVREGLGVCFPFYKHFSITSCPDDLLSDRDLSPFSPNK